MADCQSNHKISTLEIAWAAGFLEGEGWFGEGRSPKIGAAQVQLEPLERLQRLFGGKIVMRKSTWKNGIHWWVLDAYRSPAVMMTLYCLMSPKRQEKIRSALGIWRTARNMRQPGSLVCLNGHKIEGANILLVSGKYRRCRECHNANHRSWRRGKRNEALAVRGQIHKI